MTNDNLESDKLSGESERSTVSGESELTTAAEFVDTGKDSNLPAVDPKNWIFGEWRDGDELVRRSDVAGLIQDKIAEKKEEREEWQELKKSWRRERSDYAEENEFEKEKECQEEIERIKGNIRVINAKLTVLEELLEEVRE